MASHEFRLRVVVVAFHYLAQCPVCGELVSILVHPKANMLERKEPTCRHCRAEMDPDLDTIHADIRLEGSE